LAIEAEALGVVPAADFVWDIYLSDKDRFIQTPIDFLLYSQESI